MIFSPSFASFTKALNLTLSRALPLRKLPSLQLQTCYLCGCSSQSQVCKPCIQDMPFLPNNLPADLNLLSQAKIADSIVHEHFDNLYVPLAYQWPVSTLIKDLKFARKIILAKELGQLTAKHLHCIANNFSMAEAIIPVPLHPKRFRQRKYNQAFLVANEISKSLKVPILTNVCERVHYTVPQTELTGKKRRKNTKAAFYSKGLLDFQHIAIVDDVITTGATVNNLAKSLKQANPHITIDVWAIAISLHC